jgi:hypothetical protein
LSVYTVVGGLILALLVPVVAPSSVAAGSPHPVADERPPVAVASGSPSPDSATPSPDQLAAQTGTADSVPWPGMIRGMTVSGLVSMPGNAIDMSVAAEVEAALQSAEVPKARPMPYVETPLGRDVPSRIRRYEALIQRAARRYNVDPNFVAAVMMTESGGYPNVVSPKNAVGLMQVLGGPLDPEANIGAGTQLLARWLTYFGDAELALAAYNAGPGNVLRYRGVPPFPETRNHIARTMTRYAAYSGGAAAGLTDQPSFKTGSQSVVPMAWGGPVWPRTRAQP